MYKPERERLGNHQSDIRSIRLKTSFFLTLKAPIPQNGQTYSNNLSATADELFECV